MSQFYNYETFMDMKPFVSKKLPRPAEPAHIGADGKIPDRVKWQYFYLQTFFGAGTHYIILDSDIDCPDLSSLGPYGFVVANGQAVLPLAYHRS